MSNAPYGEHNPTGRAASNPVSSSAVDVTVHRGEVHFYTITEEQLDSLSSGHWQIYTSLACGFFGSFVSLLSIFLAGYSNPSPLHAAITTGAAMATGILWVVFAILAAFLYRAHARKVYLLKERRYYA